MMKKTQTRKKLYPLTVLIRVIQVHLILILMCVLPQHLVGANYGSFVKEQNSKNELSGIISLQHTVRGTVTDQNGEPLIGVNIQVKGTNKGTATDLEGNFTLENIDVNAVLVVSYVGYQTQEVEVGNQKIINVVMKMDASTLDEVVVVGYGTQRKSDLTGAVSKVAYENIENRQIDNLGKALKGQMSGLLIKESSGLPGSSPEIRIRGAASITAQSNPLVVLDGFPGADISDIDFNNVESIEVLKDAASAAIYGSRGSNGVIIITTKRGEKDRLKLDFKAYYGIQELEKFDRKLDGPDMMQYYIDAKNNAWIDQGGNRDDPNEDRPNKYRIDPYWTSEDIVFYDPIDYYFRIAPKQNYTLSGSGGSENAQYFISGSYLSQDGILKNTDYKKYSFISNVDIQATNRIKVGLSLSPSISIQNEHNSEGRTGVLDGLRYMNPIYPLNTGVYGQPQDDVPPGSYGTFKNDGINAWVRVHNLKDKRRNEVMNGNLTGNINISKGLDLSVLGGVRYSKYSNDVYRDRVYMNGGNPSGSYNATNSMDLLGETYLTYNNEFNKIHNINIMAGYSAQKSHSINTYTNGSDFANDILMTLNNASSITSAGTNEYEWLLLSYFARFNYSYQDKYLFNTNIRRDGSSRFGANSKWGIFPSVSIAWKINEESFMENIPSINLLKIRASYGVTGNNNIGNYAWQSNMGSSRYNIGTSEATQIGYYPSNISNPALGWEQNNSFNAGLDLWLLENRFLINIDYYNKITNNLLLAVPIPNSSGFGSALQNYGEIKNSGFEFELTSRNLTNILKWSTSFNFSHNKNKVLQLGPDNQPIFGGGGYAGTNIQITEVGQPLGVFYLYEQIGIYNTQEEIEASASWPGTRPGGRIIRDANNDGVINLDDKVRFGQGTPKFFWGITNNLEFKNFHLSFLFSGEGGHEVYYPGGIYTTTVRYLNGASILVKDYWKSPSDPGAGYAPRPSIDASGAQYQHTSHLLFKGDNWRLKNLTIGYTLTDNILNQVNLNDLRIFFTAENVYFHDNFPGYNPEGDIGGTVTSEGWEIGSYPNSKSYSLGINLTF